MYNYENPLNIGYQSFSISNKQYNKKIKNNKKSINIFHKNEYYFSTERESFIIDTFINNPTIFLILILSPAIFILNGILRFEETLKYLKKIQNQKNYGFFSREIIFKNDSRYQELLKMI